MFVPSQTVSTGVADTAFEVSVEVIKLSHLVDLEPIGYTSN